MTTTTFGFEAAAVAPSVADEATANAHAAAAMQANGNVRRKSTRLTV
jgi:hypothetical protein